MHCRVVAWGFPVVKDEGLRAIVKVVLSIPYRKTLKLKPYDGEGKVAPSLCQTRASEL